MHFRVGNKFIKKYNKKQEIETRDLWTCSLSLTHSLVSHQMSFKNANTSASNAFEFKYLFHTFVVFFHKTTDRVIKKSVRYVRMVEQRGG